MDSRGVGLASGALTRYGSSALTVAGSDLGPGGDFFGGSDEEDEGEDSSDGEEDMERQLAQVPPKEREEFLVQSAMARIERARARGRDDVNLNKFELAALDRRRKRMEKGDSRKKRKDQRVAVPLTQLDPVSRKNGGSRHTSMSSGVGDEGYPALGYFPPQGLGRHASDSVAELSSDPFQFQTGGSRGSRRHTSNPAELAYTTRRGTRNRSYQGSETSDEESNGEQQTSEEGDCSSDKSSKETSRGRSAIVVEPEQGPDGKPAKKTVTKNASPSKRKSTRTTASTTTRRKK